MIRFGDALLLASTKLRTRKVRTIVTAALSSLLFVIILFALSVASGLISSYERYSANSLAERYLASVSYMGPGDSSVDYGSAELIAKVKQRHAEIITQKQAEARRLGIDYDPNSEIAPVERNADDNREYINEGSLAARQVLVEQRTSEPSVQSKVAEAAAPYGLMHQYDTQSFGDTSGLRIMEQGKEDLRPESERGDQDSMQYIPGIDTIGYLPKTIAEAYILNSANTTPAAKSSDEIPVIVPFSAAEKALGLDTLPRGASSQQRLERLEQVKRDSANTLIAVCYRNSASVQLIEQARQHIDERKKNGDSPEYQPPPVEYGLPSDTSCGPAPITSDRRTVAEREYDQKLQKFNQKFELESKPEQRKLTMRIVGVSPDMPDYSTIGSIESLALMLGGSTLQGQWIVPTELVAEPLRDKIIPQTGDGGSEHIMYDMFSTLNLVEFSSADDLRRFHEEVGCTGFDCNESKPYISFFGGNSVLIEDLTRRVVDIMKWALLVIAAVAALLIAGMAGRVITDSRRETAVFRAVGAQRNDIRLVYVLYILMFSLIVVVISIGLGLIAAALFSARYEESLTASAKLMFIESNESVPYRLVGIWPLALVATAGAIVISALVSILLPLSRNLVRSPLRDMRNE